MDDRFEELLADLPDPDGGDVERIDTWRRPVRFIAWGILLTTVIFNFLYLDRLLPPVGAVLTVLGFRALRRENGGFRAAWVLSLLRLALMFAVRALRTSPFFSVDELTVPSLLLQAAQLAAFRVGMGRVFARTGTPGRLWPVNLLLAFSLLLAVGALMDWGSLGFFGILLLAGYIAVLIAVSRLHAALGDTGYALRNAPVRLSDGAFAAVALAGLLAATLCGAALGLSLSVPEAEIFTPPDEAALTEAAPAQIARILTPEDAALIDSAGNIQISWQDGAGMNAVTGLEACDLTGELPDGRVFILQYFRWLEGGPKWGDALYLTQSEGLTRTGEPSGRLVYRQRGQTYTVPFADLTAETRTLGGLFGPRSEAVIRGNVFVPLTAEDTEGYILYTLSRADTLRSIYSCQMNYYHRTLADALTQTGAPSEIQLSGDFDHRRQAVLYSAFTVGEDNGVPEGTFTVDGEQVETVAPDEFPGFKFNGKQ